MSGKKDKSDDTDQTIKSLVFYPKEIGLYPINVRKLFKDFKQKNDIRIHAVRKVYNMEELGARLEADTPVG